MIKGEHGLCQLKGATWKEFIGQEVNSVVKVPSSTMGLMLVWGTMGSGVTVGPEMDRLPPLRSESGEWAHLHKLGWESEVFMALPCSAALRLCADPAKGPCGAQATGLKSPERRHPERLPLYLWLHLWRAKRGWCPQVRKPPVKAEGNTAVPDTSARI